MWDMLYSKGMWYGIFNGQNSNLLSRLCNINIGVKLAVEFIKHINFIKVFLVKREFLILFYFI